jgi:hypothetical protein
MPPVPPPMPPVPGSPPEPAVPPVPPSPPEPPVLLELSVLHPITATAANNTAIHTFFMSFSSRVV